MYYIKLTTPTYADKITKAENNKVFSMKILSGFSSYHFSDSNIRVGRLNHKYGKLSTDAISWAATQLESLVENMYMVFCFLPKSTFDAKEQQSIVCDIPQRIIKTESEGE